MIIKYVLGYGIPLVSIGLAAYADNGHIQNPERAKYFREAIEESCQYFSCDDSHTQESIDVLKAVENQQHTPEAQQQTEQRLDQQHGSDRVKDPDRARYLLEQIDSGDTGEQDSHTQETVQYLKQVILQANLSKYYPTPTKESEDSPEKESYTNDNTPKTKGALPKNTGARTGGSTDTGNTNTNIPKDVSKTDENRLLQTGWKK